MTTEKHDPWALLREAREVVYQHSLEMQCVAPNHKPVDCSCRAVNPCRNLLVRIDAALAAHDAVPPSEEKVEWLSLCDGQENRLSLADGTRLYACSHGDGHWGWSVNRPSSYGYANTLDEAQRAALAAAGGM